MPATTEQQMRFERFLKAEGAIQEVEREMDHVVSCCSGGPYEGMVLAINALVKINTETLRYMRDISVSLDKMKLIQDQATPGDDWNRMDERMFKRTLADGLAQHGVPRTADKSTPKRSAKAIATSLWATYGHAARPTRECLDALLRDGLHHPTPNYFGLDLHRWISENIDSWFRKGGEA